MKLISNQPVWHVRPGF